MKYVLKNSGSYNLTKARIYTISIVILLITLTWTATVSVVGKNGPQIQKNFFINGLEEPYAEKPAIAIDNSGVLHVTWRDQRSGNWDIFYAKSTNNGESFGENKKVNLCDADDGIAFDPSIAVDTDGNPHITWITRSGELTSLRHTYSPNGGGSFLPSNTIGEAGWGFGWLDNPIIAIDSSNHIHIAYIHDGYSSDPNIYYQKSIDNGASFSTIVIVNGFDTVANEKFDLDIDDNGNPYVVYCGWDYLYDRDYIKFTHSTDGGISFDEGIIVDDNYEGPQSNPSLIVCDITGVHIAYEVETPDTYKIYYAHCTSPGEPFSRYEVSSGNTRNNPVIAHSICRDGPVPQIVFEKWDELSDDIYFDKPAWQSATDVDAGGSPRNPDIATHGEFTYVVWDDQLDHNIWLRRGEIDYGSENWNDDVVKISNRPPDPLDSEGEYIE